MRHLGITILLLVTSHSLFGQDVITGKIVDNRSGTEIPFATILLKGSQNTFGLISNADGSFQIPHKYKSVIDTMVVSCIGYLTLKVPSTEIRDDRFNIFKLKESVTALSEVVIRSKQDGRLNSVKIIQAAIERIPYNFPVTPYSYIAYYRDYQLKDNQYTNLNEAIVELYDDGFKTNDYLKTRIKLYDYKINKEFNRDSLTEIPYDKNLRDKFIPGATISPLGGNELGILRIHDAIRNHDETTYSFVGQFDKNFIANHSFQHYKTVYLNETPLYKIPFQTKLSASGYSHLAEGTIYIERNSFAIHKLEYSVFQRSDQNLSLLYSAQVEYVKQNSLMRLNYISFNNFFQVPSPDDFLIKQITFNIPLNAFEVTFTNEATLKSALQIQNYHITFNEQEMEIDHIELLPGENHTNSVSIFLKKLIKKYMTEKQIPNVKVEIKNVMDVRGRKLNEITYQSVNQFRELFVQKNTTRLTSPEDSIWVQKNQPLKLSPVQIMPELNASGFWMNTPLKKQ